MNTATLTRRPRLIVPTAADNGPTAERIAKGDYEDTKAPKGKPTRRRAYTVQALHTKGDITSEAVEYAGRWVSDWNFARDGYTDGTAEPLPDGYVRGDVHTWFVSRGRASERLTRIREIIGDGAHERLLMMLGHGASFTEMAKVLIPELNISSATTRVSAQCATILNILPTTYRAAVKAQKDAWDRLQVAAK